MKVLICGSRDYTNTDEVRALVRSLQPDDIVISGMARGVDRVAADEARIQGLAVIEMPADWTKGKGAGFARNLAMLDQADQVFAFWDGVSRGTKHTMDAAKERGLPLTVTTCAPREWNIFRGAPVAPTR